MKAHYLTLRRKKRQVVCGQRAAVLQSERRRFRITEVRISNLGDVPKSPLIPKYSLIDIKSWRHFYTGVLLKNK